MAENFINGHLRKQEFALKSTFFSYESYSMIVGIINYQYAFNENYNNDLFLQNSS